MTFTYDPAALEDSELFQIRLTIGDTDSDDYFLSDEEIAWVQSDLTTFNSRVSKCCLLICAEISKRVKYGSGDFNEDPALLYDRYKELANRYAVLVSVAAGSYPWSSSISVTDKETYIDDTDVVKPKFKKGLHDNNA